MKASPRPCKNLLFARPPHDFPAGRIALLRIINAVMPPPWGVECSQKEALKTAKNVTAICRLSSGTKAALKWNSRSALRLEYGGSSRLGGWTASPSIPQSGQYACRHCFAKRHRIQSIRPWIRVGSCLRSTVHRYHPHLVDGRGAAGQFRSSRHADGLGAGDLYGVAAISTL